MRSLSGALRFGHPESAARPARGGRGRSAGPARRVQRGCEHHAAPGQQAPQRAYRHPGPALGSGPHRGRPGHPPPLRPRQARQVPAALSACGEAPEPGGPPAPGRGLRRARPRAGPGRRARGRGRAPRTRRWRTLSPGPGTGAEPDDGVLAGRPARHAPRCPRAGVYGSTGESLAAGNPGPLCAGTRGIPGLPRPSGSAPAAPLPAGDAPGRTRLGAVGPGQPPTTVTNATATHAARRADAPRPRELTRPGVPAPCG